MTVAVLTASKNEGLTSAERCLLTLDWTSATGGTVSLSIATALGLGTDIPILGDIRWIETVPGNEGDLTTDTPDQYTVTLLDEYGADVADGRLSNRSNLVAERVVFEEPLACHGDLTLTVTTAGDAKKGRILILFDLWMEAWTYTLLDSVTGLPISGATITISTDVVGLNKIRSGTTNASGVAVFWLEAGTYYIWRSKTGYTFTDPDIEVVS